MKNLIKRLPVIRFVAKAIYFTCIAPFRSFPGSRDYWKQRYRTGATSGSGSYRKFAEFKAEVLNGFVKDHEINSVIEFGCGDGNQLKLSDYPSYFGYDVSPEAIGTCEATFREDTTKTFGLNDFYAGEKAELALSLDVIYHLVEDEVFEKYMATLFDASTKFVIIYSSNTDAQERLQAAHVRYRKFSDWVSRHRPGWELIQHTPNRYPYSGDDLEGSFSDFYVYKKM
ncbi:MAG TPA: hypothetical protein VIT83_00820 [Gammaproteobacteria bacterium]